jgi:hypothetical protein
MKFDHTKPFKTRGGQVVELVTDKGRGELKFVGYIADDKDISTWYADGGYLLSRASEYDLVNVKPLKLPDPPEGMQWHRDDWTEEMLPGIKRPLLLGETGTYEILLNGVWKEGTALDIPTPCDAPFMRTDRPLPSAPKMVPLTFEYVSGFVGVEVRADVHQVLSVLGMDHNSIALENVRVTWDSLQRNEWQWRSFQNPTWQPCKMEEKA